MGWERIVKPPGPLPAPVSEPVLPRYGDRHGRWQRIVNGDLYGLRAEGLDGSARMLLVCDTRSVAWSRRLASAASSCWAAPSLPLVSAQPCTTRLYSVRAEPSLASTSLRLPAASWSF